MQQGSRIKPVMARAEGWFAVFGRIGVIPSQLLPSCLGKIEIVTLKVIQGCFVIFRVQEGGEVTAPARMERRKREKIDAECILQNKNSYFQKARWYD